MKSLIFLLLLLTRLAYGGELPKADAVLVRKNERKMYLLKNEKPFREYKVVLGANPKGHKQQKGDERTPEGQYVLDYKKSDSDFYKAIHISYPNDDDRKRAWKSGVNPGGSIMIHGQKNELSWLSFISQSLDWTNGCIAVKNHDMDEIWKAVCVGTPITIEP